MENNIVGNTYDTKCGKVTIIEDLGMNAARTHMVRVRFENPNILNTNTTAVISLSNLMRNKIKDLYQPTFAGVACTGNPNKDFPLFAKARQIWENMIKFTNCSPDNPKYKYYGHTVVYPRWLCFEYFLEDLPSLPGYDMWLQNPDEYVFDKDYRTNGTTNEYSPWSCMFIDINTNKTKKAIREAIAAGRYLGVRQKSPTTYEAIFWNQSIGTFTNALAAASMYNHCARYNQVPECNMNQLGENEMPIMEAMSYMVEPVLRNGLVSMMVPLYRYNKIKPPTEEDGV